MDLLETIKNQTLEFLDAMGYVHVSPAEVKERDSRVFVSVFIRSPRDLIGERGATLRSFQHLVRLAIVKKLGSSPRIDVDVNNYKKRRAR